MTFFDKMSCRRARVKIKIGMVTLSHPSVYGKKIKLIHNKNEITRFGAL